MMRENTDTRIRHAPTTISNLRSQSGRALLSARCRQLIPRRVHDAGEIAAGGAHIPTTNSMQARTVALLLIIATLWSLIGIQDLDPSFDRPFTTPVVVDSARSAAAADRPAETQLLVATALPDEARLFKLSDRIWFVPAEIPADLPDVLHDGHDLVPVATPATPLLRQRPSMALPPYLDSPRRPPRGGLPS